jgi:hypothetical protein
MFMVGDPPGRDPGGIVAYEYEQQARPYVAEYDWFLQENIPRLNQSFTLALPPGFTYKAVWARHDAMPSADLETDRWCWEMKDTPAIDLRRVTMHPASLALTGRMTVHYAAPGSVLADQASWKGIGEWYQKLSQDRLAATPEITAKAQALVAGKTDFYDKTEVIAEFVQKQVRYFALEMGVGGYQPHFAGDIYRNLYGDCKDKATLLSAMLSSVGIHSALMMVDDRRGVIVPNAPSLVGNHMIAAIEIPKGYDSPHLRSVITAQTGRRYLIFDPTWEKTPFGQLEHELQGSYGVLMEGADSQVVALPVLSPSLNTIRRTATFQLQPDGSLHGSVVEKRFGDVSDRRRDIFTSADAKQQSEFVDHVLEQDFTSFKVSDFKVANALSLNQDLTTTYTLEADGFARNMGPLLMVRPRVLGSENLAPDREKRLVPVDLRETMLEQDDFDITIPAGYAVDEVPDPVKLDLGFAAYQSSTQIKNNVLHYSRTYTVRAVTLPAEQYGDLERLAGVIAADEQSRAVLKKQ